eukprot:TRINITY_DN29364_c0_g1_i1.p1 TRINITY_DN29364_c0_g1~~TRINITY_DN29364_c0_g1_i1.p1  ORF type:complete len:152 (+),score=20.45 TRINITY_DN29364_c0_g1_i1:56-457(+)
MDRDRIRQAAAVAGASGVAIGAFGAHGLKQYLEKHGRLASFQTGVQYHLLHSIALLALSAASRKSEWSLTAKLWTSGIVLFSGSIYGLCLGGPKVLGPVTPMGGLLFIAGWVSLAFTPQLEQLEPASVSRKGT